MLGKAFVEDPAEQLRAKKTGCFWAVGGIFCFRKAKDIHGSWGRKEKTVAFPGTWIYLCPFKNRGWRHESAASRDTGFQEVNPAPPGP
jgi:hypothetical protein